MTLAGCIQKLAVLVSIVLAVAACGDGSKSDTPQKATGLRKKIAVPQNAKAPGEETKAATSAQSPEPTQQVQESAKDTAEPVPPEKRGLIEPKESEGLKLAEGLGKKEATLYDPRGKMDPFKSAFDWKTEAEAPPPSEQNAKKKRIPLTPLQKFELDQLRLVAIVIAPSGNKALVEDTGGKGYVVSRGTYMGTNFGRVQSIRKDRIIIEEEVRDFVSGSMKKRTRELRIKPEAGEKS